ncbi:MAG: PASTA domain-containing protein [Deltaproteobacteria bacterium]|nr:MAG: PASTA domain-containing protein [Deltaproteobacteria bacterium]
MNRKGHFALGKTNPVHREKNKVVIVFFFFVACFLIILGKAFYLQVFNRTNLMKYSADQIFRERIIYPNRGNIYDRNGSPLAINIQTWSIFSIPKQIKSPRRSYKRLAKIVPTLTYKKLRMVTKNRKRYTWLARKISLTKTQVKKVKKIKGIYLEPVPKRFYPNKELLSQTLGFVGLDNTGLAGVEYQFDEYLKGKAKVFKYIKDAKGRPIKYETEILKEDAKDLYLTIDKDLQDMAEKALKEAVIKFNALKGGIGVMDVQTGEVLALANYPTFNPNNIKDSKPEDRKLAFVSDPFEPGSIFKTFTVASALEHKLARPDTNYYCEKGAFEVGDHVINEAVKGKGYEWLSMSEIIKYSSNIGTTKIAFDLTFPRLRETLKNFNIGEKTGIEIPGESRGIFTAKENLGPLKLSNISFGQGVATTGIQILAAYATLANGGFYIKPTIIKKENYSPNKVRIISKKTAQEITKMLVDVVNEGTGSKARIPFFEIAGKTSTAQKPGKEGGYEGYIPGFIGYPVNVDKRFVIYVYVDGPIGKNYFGNTIAAPVFKKVAKFLIYKNKEFNNLADLGKSGDGPLPSLDKIDSGDRNLGQNEVPNFLGLDKRSSATLAQKKALKLVHLGIGVVISQSPSPKSEIGDNQTVELMYSPPKYE